MAELLIFAAKETLEQAQLAADAAGRTASALAAAPLPAASPVVKAGVVWAAGDSVNGLTAVWPAELRTDILRLKLRSEASRLLMAVAVAKQSESVKLCISAVSCWERASKACAEAMQESKVSCYLVPVSCVRCSLPQIPWLVACYCAQPVQSFHAPQMSALLIVHREEMRETWHCCLAPPRERKRSSTPSW